MALLLWRYTKAGTPRPRSLTEILTGQAEAAPTVMVFRDGAAFDEALARFIE